MNKMHRESPKPFFLSPAYLEELARRRQSLLERLKPGEVLIVGSVPLQVRGGSIEETRRQDGDFLYLVGIDEAESVAVFSRAHSQHRFVLFLRPCDMHREVWEGPAIGPENAPSLLGADAAFPIQELEARLPDYLANALRVHHSFGRHPALDAKILSARDVLRRRERNGIHWPRIFCDLAEVVHPLRLRKSAFEVDMIREAVRITEEAHLRAMRAGRPGAYEYNVEAELLFTFKSHGAKPAYECIVGAGSNATILHYRRNTNQIQDGDLVLVDAGAEFGHYASDITRTFPANGRFTPIQRAIYQSVLNAQLQAISAARPGVTLETIHHVAVRAITQAAIELNLIAGPLDDAIASERYKAIYPHRTSHWLGVDVHDAGPYFLLDSSGAHPSPQPTVLEPGMVITIEPGIYVRPHEHLLPSAAPYLYLGVRIEDDILITEHGAEVLSTRLPKEPDAIEALLGGC
ncbi:MAG: aminopeptidase P N-terminal domain-containing protein [Sandaracinaceae bacterium]|nr:aminopeptidase P N-terminal domain-containing protein [Sandaracinaceae bacterium]